MRYIVVCVLAGKVERLAEKQSMDDALDVIKNLEDFDEGIGVRVIDEYRVMIEKEA